jgi:hypothetical protein
MNKENVLQFLVKFINGFVYNKELISELTEIISKTGGEKRFFTLMVNKLRLLAELGLDAVQLTEFENIGQGIFSMHLATKLFNIRILYGFLPNSEPVLLLAFYERAGKRRTNYSSYIEPARRRLEEEEERFKNE